MKVTEIEVHQIMLEYQDFLAYQLNHYYGPTKRTIYIAHTDSGLEGLGEKRYHLTTGRYPTIYRY